MAAEWKNPCWNVIAGPGGPMTCLLTWCCPCVTYGINLSKLGDAKEQHPDVYCAGEFTPACCLYCLTASVGCMCIVHMPVRKYLRKKYGIKEPQHGMLEDFLLTWCCSCCVLIQDYNEIAAQSGATTGSVMSDLKKAADTASADVKKHTSEAKEAVAKSLEKKEDAKTEDKKEEKKEDAPAAAEAK